MARLGSADSAPAGTHRTGTVAATSHVDVAELEVQVRRLGLPVEDDRGSSGGSSSAKASGVRRTGSVADVAGVDAEGLGQRPADVVPEGVVADLGEHRGDVAEAGRGDGHVGRRPADRLAERARPRAGARPPALRTDRR